MTKEGSILKDYDEALKTLKDPKSRFSFQDKTNFIEAAETLKYNKVPIALTPLKFVEPKQIEAKSKFLLPDGWKFEHLNEKLIIFTAADGSQFYSRLQAIEYMIENDVEAKIIYPVWQTLAEEDWKFGLEYVPEGWGVREQLEGKDYLFLTR